MSAIQLLVFDSGQAATHPEADHTPFRTERPLLGLSGYELNGRYKGAKLPVILGCPFKFSESFRADLMDDPSEFLYASAEQVQLLLADPVVYGVARLGVRFPELLEHRALAARSLGPDAIKAAIEPFG
jgi:hypothetical protein